MNVIYDRSDGIGVKCGVQYSAHKKSKALPGSIQFPTIQAPREGALSSTPSHLQVHQKISKGNQSDEGRNERNDPIIKKPG